MKNQEINDRIAKLCGWTVESVEEHDDGYSDIWTPPNRNDHFSGPPLYTESLEACREFMSQIHGLDRVDFVEIVQHLERVNPLYEYEERWALITLTPLELCEAFLRLKWQWE